MNKKHSFGKVSLVVRIVVVTAIASGCFIYLRLYVDFFELIFPESLVRRLKPTYAREHFLIFVPLLVTVYSLVFTIIYKLIARNMSGSKLENGFRFGICLALIWYVGLVGVPFFFHAPFKHELIAAFSDAISVFILGIFAGLLLSDPLKKAEQPRDVPALSKTVSLLPLLIFPIPILGVHGILSFFFTDPMSPYTMVLLVPHSVDQYLYLVLMFAVIGLIFVILAPAMHPTSVIRQNVYFSFGFFGIHWVFFQAFFPVFYAGILLPAFLMSLMHVLLVFGCAVFCSALQKKREAPVSSKIRLKP